jgi:AcrR family transcriptional regulator
MSMKDRIYHSSLQLFVQKGTQAVSIRDIAKVVGTSPSTFYNHYPSKEALILAMYSAFEEKVVQRSFSSQELPPQSEIGSQIIQGFQDFLSRLTEEDQLVARVILGEQLRHPEAGRLAQEFFFTRPKDYFLALLQRSAHPQAERLSSLLTKTFFAFTVKSFLAQSQGGDPGPVYQETLAEVQLLLT